MHSIKCSSPAVSCWLRTAPVPDAPCNTMKTTRTLRVLLSYAAMEKNKIWPATKETQQVWDFAGDGFVHRLIHNKADGKLVEVSDLGQTSEERPQMPARLSDIQVRWMTICEWCVGMRR